MSYQQPMNVRFSHDSVELADRLAVLLLAELLAPRSNSQSDSQAQSLREPRKVLQIMDLCCGCGIVGLETERRFRDRVKLLQASDILLASVAGRGARRSWTFLDVQEAYQEFFELNSATLSREWNDEVSAEGRPRHFEPPESCVWVGMNYCDLVGHEHYRATFDWIVSNPPYFDPSQGRLPSDGMKARSRFFLDGSFEELLAAIRWSLSPWGKALILVRDLSDHRIGRGAGLRKIFSDGEYQLDWLEPIRGTDLLLISAKPGF